MTPDQTFALWFVSMNLRERVLEREPLSLPEMQQVAEVLDHTRDEFETIDHLLKGLTSHVD